MRAHSILVGLLLADAASGLRARESPPASNLPSVEVTGSRIKRVDADTVSPVLVLDQEDIRRTGAESLKELFERISNVGRGIPDTGGRGTFAAGSSQAGLRGLGTQSTLVLLNSRRVAPYPLAQYSEIFTNIDSLPLEAVERVEILRSGGSAIYGSEAVAGVINIITRPGYQGVHARASSQRSDKTGNFRSDSASLTAGFGDLATDRYNVLTNLEVYHRDGVVWSEVLSFVNPKATAPFPSFGTPSTFSYPGNVLPAGAVPGCDPARVSGGLCFYDRYQRFEAMPAAKRVNLMTSAKLRLDGGLVGFAEALYSRTETTYISAFQPYGPALGTTVWANPSNSEIRSFTYRGLPAGHPLNPTGRDDAEFRYRFVDGPNDTSAQANQYRVLAGLRGTVDRFEWESAVGIMGGRADQRSRGVFSESGFRQVIGNYDPGQVDPQFFNRDYRIGQPNSAATLNTLFPEYGYRGSTTETFVDGKIAGEVLRFEGRPVAIAAGFDLRHQRFAVTPSESLRTGDIVGEGMASSDASRTHGALFGEVNLPLTADFELQAAARLDKFPGFAAHLSPKLGMRFEVNPLLKLRGTVESGFRAPNLSESAASTRYSSIPATSDPKRCSQAQALARDLRAAAAALPTGDPNKVLLAARADSVTNAECIAVLASIVRNNPNLQPETSRNATVGLVFQPAHNIDLVLDYWYINRKNEIGLQDLNKLLPREDTLAPGIITRADVSQDRSFTPAERAAYGVSAGALVSLTGGFENELRTQTAGVDFAWNAHFKTDVADLALRVNGTYLTRLRYYSAAISAYGDNLVGRGGASRVRTDISAVATRGAFTHGLTWNYGSGTTMNFDYYDTDFNLAGCAARGWSADQCRNGALRYWDYHFAYAEGKGLAFGLNIRNVFNTRTPINLRGILTGGGGIIPQDVADVMGRMVRGTVEYRFR